MFRPGGIIRGQNTVHPLAIAAPTTAEDMVIVSATIEHAPVVQVARLRDRRRIQASVATSPQMICQESTMRLVKSYVLGLSLVSGLGIVNVSHQPVLAQCLQADVSLQYNISGSRKPANQTNDVVMEGEDGCVGNTSVTTGVQGNVGGSGPVEQHRQVRHKQTNGPGGGSPFGSKPVQIKNNVQVDIYNPADDPEFMGKFR